MGIRKIIDIVRKLEEQRRLTDPFYANFHDKESSLLEHISGVDISKLAGLAKLVSRVDVALDALWFKCQETEYRVLHIEDLTQKLARRTYDRTIVTKSGPKVRVSLGIDSDTLAFEFNAFLQVAKSACDKLARVAYILMAVDKQSASIKGLRYRSIRDFIKSAQKMEGHLVSDQIIDAWGSWIKDLNECRDFVEHHGRYFMYARHPYVNFPIMIPPPKWLYGLTRLQINSLSFDELPMGNIDLPVYCRQVLDQLQQLVIKIITIKGR